MEDDVKEDEVTSENLEGDSSAPEAEEKEEQTVPYQRFREVNTKMRDLEQQINSLKSERKETGSLTDEQQRELKAKEYLRGLLREELTAEKQTQEETKKKEQQEFERDVNEVMELHSGVKRNEFLAFLEKEGDDYASVEAAMRSYKRLHNVVDETSEKTKRQVLGKPGLPKSEGKSEPSGPPPEDKNKSLWQIAQEAARELRKGK